MVIKPKDDVEQKGTTNICQGISPGVLLGVAHYGTKNEISYQSKDDPFHHMDPDNISLRTIYDMAPRHSLYYTDGFDWNNELPKELDDKMKLVETWGS
jgi:hypothetical protein